MKSLSSVIGHPTFAPIPRFFSISYLNWEMKKFLLGIFILSLCSCTVQRIKKSVRDSEVFAQGHIGFMLVDPEKDKTIYALNEAKYFITASNTKLFTFYTSYKTLGEGKVNGLNYIQKEDSLIFWGTGDPSVLHPDFQDSTLVQFLRGAPQKLYMVNTFSQVPAFGSGWSWDWYNYYYATERSAFPIYGNVIRVTKDTVSELLFTPDYFINQSFEDIQPGRYSIIRDRNENTFHYGLNMELKDLNFETDKPFVTSAELTADMLSKSVGREIELLEEKGYHKLPHQKLPTVEADSIYAQMMKISDNFLAEQLLLLVSDKLFDSLDVESSIKYAKGNLLQFLPDEPQWVDGSGLSAKNMFTPRSIVALLDRIRDEVPMEKIKAYFPSGGVSGTIRNFYKADPGMPPYIYAKTGTLSMSNALSGYLITKSGKTLLYSFLLNNYILSGNELKKEMEKVLYGIYQNY